MPHPAPVRQETKPPIPFWKRIPAWVYAMLAALGLVITLASAYPWLRIEQDALLDLNNPFSELFAVVNDGYIPVTNLDATCTTTFSGSSSSIGKIEASDNSFYFRGFAEYLGHDGRSTIPCFNVLNLPGVTMNEGATLKVEIEYAFLHVNLKPLRRSQKFRFQTVVAKDGTHHWLYLN